MDDGERPHVRFDLRTDHPPAPCGAALDNGGRGTVCADNTRAVTGFHARKRQVVVPKKDLRGVDIGVDHTLLRERAAAASRTFVDKDGPEKEGDGLTAVVDRWTRP